MPESLTSFVSFPDNELVPHHPPKGSVGFLKKNRYEFMDLNICDDF